MRIPESLQDLADSEAVRFLKRPKTVGRIFAGVRPSRGRPPPGGQGGGAGPSVQGAQGVGTGRAGKKHKGTPNQGRRLPSS